MSTPWEKLIQQIQIEVQSTGARQIFGSATQGAAAYHWGTSLATAASNASLAMPETSQALPSDAALSGPEFAVLAKLACDQTLDEAERPIDLAAQLLESFRQAEWSNSPRSSWQPLIMHVVLAGALAQLTDTEQGHWWDLLGLCHECVEQTHDRTDHPVDRLIGVGELGLTLSWRLSASPSCQRLRAVSIAVITEVCDHWDQLVTETIARPHELRLVLASLLRCRMIAEALNLTVQNRRFADCLTPALIELSTWAAALTGQDGRQAFYTGDKLTEDAGANGLLIQAANLEPESLLPAMRASCGQSKTGGKLAWQVSLPESMLHDEHAKIACMLPEWDVRRGRCIVRYREPQTQWELSAGKRAVFAGAIETQVIIDGQPMQLDQDWEATCEYSDDDVHYLEIEQPLGADYLLQRQFCLIREEQAIYFADAIVHADPSPAGTCDAERSKIEYQTRIPLAPEMSCRFDPDTTDGLIGTWSAAPTQKDATFRPRALLLPLFADEWRQSFSNAPVTGTIQQTEDEHLLIQSTGQGQLYTPLWIDMRRKRFTKARTWRQLDVCYQLASVRPDQAAGFRVQIGKQHWIMYRSMGEAVPRTFFGKQMIADFYLARFNPRERSYEDLVTVDDS